MNQILQNSLNFYNKGVEHLKLNDFERAINFFEKSVELTPNLFQAHYNLGNIFKKLNKFDRAVHSYQNCIKINSHFVNAYYNLANTFKEQGNLDEARIYYTKTLKLKPNFFEVYENLKIIDGLSDLIKKVKPKKNKDKKKLITLKNPYISHREIEYDLLKKIKEIDSLEIAKKKLPDARYGNGKISDFELFYHDSRIIKKVKKELINIMEKAINSKIYIKESFFNIFGKESGVIPHNHINSFDYKMGYENQKYSLVYYIEVGDQKSNEPGILKLFYKEKEILQIIPSNGTIVIFPADQIHSAAYNGKKDRIMIGINFYGL